MLEDVDAVPSTLAHSRFVAVPLTVQHAERDFAAYTASPPVVAVHSGGRWPVAGFTLDQELRLIAQHQADHASRRAFTFTLLNPAETAAVGCLYLNSLHEYLRRTQADDTTLRRFPHETAMVTFWIRQDLLDNGLPEAVAETVHAWLSNDWPLTAHYFRVLPDELSTVSALQRLGLPNFSLQLPREPRPYRWYGP